MYFSVSVNVQICLCFVLQNSYNHVFFIPDEWYAARQKLKDQKNVSEKKMKDEMRVLVLDLGEVGDSASSSSLMASFRGRYHFIGGTNSPIHTSPQWSVILLI